MSIAPDDPRRPDLRQALQRDIQRHARREQGQRSFWRALSLLGSVGWPIVLLAAGGAVVGHWLDTQWHTGVRWALILVTCGTSFGCWMAWHLLGAGRR
jgi:ATP synthase protein I